MKIGPLPWLIACALSGGCGGRNVVKTTAAADKAAIEWVAIPGGSFLMGAEDLGATPVHRVTIKRFEMAKTPVTNKQYRACVASGACTPAADCGDDFRGDDQPVVCVDWQQAAVFCQWARARLPSEAEWEYAARSAGKDWKYPWGDEDPTCDRAVVHMHGMDCGRRGTWPVCSKPKGNTEQGLCDMAGNVWEWVQDYYHGSYEGAPSDGSAWEDRGSSRLARGGSWDVDASRARASLRDDGGPARPGRSVGFRPARTP